jgi:hypothetical protein
LPIDLKEEKEIMMTVAVLAVVESIKVPIVAYFKMLKTGH